MTEPVPYSHLKRGSFLVASPEMSGSLFFRGVILLCEHTDTGSFGLLINKTLIVDLPEEIVDVNKLANPNVELRTSGPIQTNQMMILHNDPSIPEQTLKICEGVYLGGDLPYLQEATSKADGHPLRLCFGYSAWTAGQLEKEFLDGLWFLCPASSRHIFDTSVDKLWQALLREMGGKYAPLSMFPEDLSLN